MVWLQKLLVYEPTGRITAREALKHPYFAVSKCAPVPIHAHKPSGKLYESWEIMYILDKRGAYGRVK